MSTAEQELQPIVSTRSGMVMGREKNGVLMFNGIPYAAPPTGERRFKRATPPESWDDVRDATRFSPAAPQLPSGGMTNSVPVKWDEDCLYLNVTTPAADEKRRPVMVWIHGGGFRSGQGAVPWYNGTSFAQQGDIVVVSINYRMGVFGFADLSRFGDEYATSGINGILDQIVALEWVRDNIAAFGGDRDQVTIAGESAGGFSVSMLLASERAQGLFKRAIPQSGAAHFALSPEAAGKGTDLLMADLKAESMDDLLQAPAIDLLEAQGRIDTEWTRDRLGGGVQAFYPTSGNEVLPDSPRAAIKRGVGREVTVLTGTNKDESTLFIFKAPSRENLQKQAESMGDASLVEKFEQYLPEASDLELAIAMNTDYMFRVPCIRLAEMRAELGAKTWVYQFDWESRAPHLKAAHAIEIPFMFNTLGAPGVDAFIGPGELPQHVADEMHSVWIRFIRGEEPEWPLYETGKRAVWHFDNTSQLVENGEPERLAAWEGIR